jgi:hypothetical protein
MGEREEESRFTSMPMVVDKDIVETVGGTRPGVRRWRETMGAGSLAAIAGAHGRKTTWWLTCGPSVPANLIHFSKAPTSKFTNMIFPMSKNSQTY